MSFTRFLNLVYAWIKDRVNPEEWEKVEEQIFAPMPGELRDPDQVDAKVIDEEMALFETLSRQTKNLGG